MTGHVTRIKGRKLTWLITGLETGLLTRIHTGLDTGLVTGPLLTVVVTRERRRLRGWRSGGDH